VWNTWSLRSAIRVDLGECINKKRLYHTNLMFGEFHRNFNGIVVFPELLIQIRQTLLSHNCNFVATSGGNRPSLGLQFQAVVNRRE
jgi:hypothetical protein